MSFIDKFLTILVPKKNYDYGDLGYFSKKDPKTSKYTFANWGSRKWEYCYLERMLNEISIVGKKVVDIGIGLPTDSNFYTFYTKSGCILYAFDLDTRLKKKTILSKQCFIYRQSAEKVDLPSKSVDVAVVLSTFEHIPFNIFIKTVKEIYRILKDNGQLIVTLDLTYNKKRSARWAILEKTLNGLTEAENDRELTSKHQHLTMEYFTKMISPYFYTKTKEFKNKNLCTSQLVYSKEWNSYIGYAHFYKK